jgi:hypothetical protein
MGELSGWYEGENGAIQFYVQTKDDQDMFDAIGQMYAGDPDFGDTDMEVEYDGEDVTAKVYGIMKQVKFIKIMGGNSDG